MGCGPLPGCLRNKRCIYAVDTFDDNLCVWRCLAIYKRKDIQRATELVTRTALNLAREYYGDKKLKEKDVRPTKLVGFGGIARHYDVNIMLYVLKKGRARDVGSIWRLVYGKIQHKSDLPTINMVLLGGPYFYIKKMDVLCGQWEYKGCRQIFTRNDILRRRNVLEEKQKSFAQAVNLSTS